jgi:oxepin-CoA hydrolase/3-oxo-5,6-dehydrosuberyl-CoA semialdehyde dehydrogenase
MKLKNYSLGKWIEGDGEGIQLINAVNDEIISYASSDGLDFNAILNYARTYGGPALRKMTFQERGRMLKALALYLTNKKGRLLFSKL